MEDNGNIIYYVILGAIYILSKVFGKKKKKPGAIPPNQKRNITPPTAAKEEAEPISFEEILRELSGAKQPKPVSDPELIPSPAYTPLPEPGRTMDSIQGEAYSVGEIDEIAVDYEVPKDFGQMYTPQPEIKRKVLTFERDDHFKIKEKRTVDYLDVLSEEDGAAKAFVLSEIFARKY